MEIKELKIKSYSIEPTLRIGKSGLRDSVIQEIKNQLRTKKLIKIKLLKAALEEKSREQLRDEILEKTDATLIHHVGFIITLYKR